MMKLYRGPLPSLVSSAARQERFIVWCKDCRRQVDDDPADQVDRYAAKRRFWQARLARSRCGGPQVDMVATGTQRCADQG